MARHDAVRARGAVGAIALVVGLGVAGCAHSPTQTTSCAPGDRNIAAAVAQSEAYVEQFRAHVAETLTPEPAYGLSVAVSMCGETVWREAFGYADLESMTPATVETKFRVGSVSKPFTSAALGQLVEAGALDLDADIHVYLPDYPASAAGVTSRQLAGHLAGIRDYKDDEFFSAAHYDSVRAGLAVFENDPLTHAPGAAYAYSSYGWNLLSAVIEGAAGEPFLDYVRDNVFVPAQMADTVADEPASLIANRSRFYHYYEEHGENRNAPYVDNSIKWAGGGFLSTPSDMLRFGRAMTDGTLVRPETFALLTTSLATTDGTPTNYGLGWSTDMYPRESERSGAYYSPDVMASVAERLDAPRIIGHTGGAVGGLTIFMMLPDAPGEVSVAAVSNNSAVFPAFALPVASAFVSIAREAESGD